MKIYKTYKGYLDTFIEQGMEHLAPTIYDDSKDRKDGPWERTYFFGRKEGYIVIKKEGKEIYSGPWTFSRENTSINNYMASPKEIDPKKWRGMFDGKHRVIFKEEDFIKNEEKMIIKSFLDTDLYKLTMMQFAYHTDKRKYATYALRCRSGEKLGYLKDDIIEQIKYLKLLRFSEEEIAYLKSTSLFREDFLSYLTYFNLGNVQFDVKDIDGFLDIRVSGPWDSSIVVEVPLLAIVQELHFQKINKKENLDVARGKLLEKIELVKKEKGLKITDFGTRRRFSRLWHEEVVSTLKNELGDQLAGTSNVLLAKKLGINPIGTMAHEFFQAFQVLGTSFETSQKEALYAWHKEYGDKLNVALTDILGTEIFLHDCDKDLTEKYKGYRHDSGDPIVWGYRMLSHFHEMGQNAKEKVLVFSDGLNIPKAIKIYNEFKEKTNVSFGIGTNLTNDFSSHKPLSLVMKLVEMNGQKTIKVSDEPAKITCEDENLIKSTLEYIKKVKKYPVINVAVDAIIKNKKGEVLIIQRGDKGEAGYKKWALPGGFVDYFETTDLAVKREVEEELGVKLKKVKLKKVLDDPDRDPRGRVISIVYQGTIEGEIKPNEEVLSFKWVKSVEGLAFGFDHKNLLKEVLGE